ncbi:hypothetical protein OAM67_01450 [bacterium]|nr:hypothetical protein [bacterium]
MPRRVFNKRNKRIYDKFVCCAIEPHVPLRKTVYKCDSKFHVEQVLELHTAHKVLGIAFVTGDLVRFTTVRGTEVQKLWTKSVHRGGSSRKGGQSANRFQNIRDNNEHALAKEIRAELLNYFWDFNTQRPVFDKWMLCGNGPMFSNVMLPPQLTPTQLDTVTMPHCTTVDCQQLYRNYQSQLTQSQNFEEDLRTALHKNKMVYGKGHVLQAARDKILKRVWIEPHLVGKRRRLVVACESYGCTVILGSCETLRQLGGICGERFF